MKSVQPAQGKVGQILARGNQAPWPLVRARLNSLLSGWSAYFGYGTRLTAYRAVDHHVYERVREQFSEDELVHLSLAIVAINGWNRLNIAARTVPGDYVAGSLAKLHAAS